MTRFATCALNFIDKAKSDGKPFFVWLNPTRMHIVTHLSPKYEALRNSENGWSEEEAGMAQLDDDIGLVMQKLKDDRRRRQHYRGVHHRQRHGSVPRIWFGSPPIFPFPARQWPRC